MKKLLAIPAILLAQSAWADPFEECPAQAFLTQKSVPETYAVNLVTGDYRLLASSMGTSESVNGIGFNPEDKYAYGWSYEHDTVVRIHDDWTVEPLAINNISGSTGFFIGDVHPNNNKYYVYRRGASYGLYSVNLDSSSPDYLKMEQIVDGQTLTMFSADMAINPVDEYGYSVDSRGWLYQINLSDGSHTILAETGEKGGYGASYFDPNGNLYISRNSDGKIFKIAVSSGDYTPVLFASGPASSINDGFRCALAPVIDAADTAIDFGDAPDSYGTSLDNNGARHGLSSNPGLFLGTTVDGESDSSSFPLSDDKNDKVDDEDGIGFATSLVEGKRAVVVVKASGAGYMNAWVDVDRNGTFDSNDQIMQDVSVRGGKQAFYVDVPAGVSQGESWARFRLSSTPGLAPTGGAPDGEVEDYQVKLVEESTTINYYPSATGWTTIAFEDNWPHEGDYDMNDLVAYMRTATHTKSSGVTRVDIVGEIAAVGAAYHNGFGIRLPGVKRSMVDEANVKLNINGKEVDTWMPLEPGREEAILMVTYNLWDYIDSGELCLYYRTEPGCGGDVQMTFKATVPMLETVPVKLKGAYDPFLFATPGAWHGGHFVEAPGRGYEIHLKNHSPTEAFDASLFDAAGDDASNPPRTFFHTARGLPWALEVGTRWDYPIEYEDIAHAYWLFPRYAQTNGRLYRYWYNPRFAKSEYIFSH